MKIGQDCIGVFHATTGQLMRANGAPLAFDTTAVQISDLIKLKHGCSTPIKIERFKLVRIKDKEVDNANK